MKVLNQGKSIYRSKCSQATSITYGGCVFTSWKLKTKCIQRSGISTAPRFVKALSLFYMPCFVIYNLFPASSPWQTPFQNTVTHGRNFISDFSPDFTFSHQGISRLKGIFKHKSHLKKRRNILKTMLGKTGLHILL